MIKEDYAAMQNCYFCHGLSYFECNFQLWMLRQNFGTSPFSELYKIAQNMVGSNAYHLYYDICGVMNMPNFEQTK